MSFLPPAWSNVSSAYTPVDRSRFSQPFNGDSGAYVLEQDWQFNNQSAAWAPTALNTAHPVFTSYYLVSEGPLSDLGGGEVKWTRTYAQVPSSRDDENTMNYEFIGYYGFTFQAGGTAVAGPGGRFPFTASCSVRVHNDYFMIGAGGSYATAALIPLLYRLRYYVPAGSWVGSSFVPTTTNPTTQALTGSPIKVLWDSTSTIPNTSYAINLTPATVPSRSAYEALVAAQSEIIAEDSQLTRWKGNIYQRATKYIVAQ
jgi:hypothetical protein